MRLQVNLCFIPLIAAYCGAEKQLWNDQTDILLEYFSIGYRAANFTDLPIMDIKNGTNSISGMRLGDITTIKRLSDVVMETNEAGDTIVSGGFTLEKFELKITVVRYGNYFGPAIMSCKNNSADIVYRIKNPTKVHSCRTKWEKFRLGEFSDIKIITIQQDSNNSTQPDMTSEFNQRILPTINHYINSPEFLTSLSKTFDFCTYKKYLFPL